MHTILRDVMESTLDLDGILIPTRLFRVSMVYIPPACQSLSRASHVVFGITYKIQDHLQFQPSTGGQHKTDCMSLILHATQNKICFCNSEIPNLLCFSLFCFTVHLCWKVFCDFRQEILLSYGLTPHREKDETVIGLAASSVPL